MSQPLGPTSTCLTGTARANWVDAAAEACPREDGTYAVVLALTVQAPWHLYAPGSTVGLPVSVSAESPAELVHLTIPQTPNGELTGTVEITGTLSNAAAGSRLRIRTQVCDGPRCERPHTTELLLA
ncbi:hypothetical protein ACFT9I_16585 [Streptomyces sp. NPDC057137]|uniref:hypothetical protein n=1 Tax=Streptomyces sp. NPDC057137 TaxID=3346030 RepID=UPI0036404A34